MSATIFSLILAALGADAPSPTDAKALLDTMESLLGPVEDFRCEFEGQFRFMGRALEDETTRKSVDANGVSDTFLGTYIWKRDGDLSSDILKRLPYTKLLFRKTRVVRMSRNQAERFDRMAGDSLAQPEISDAKRVDLYGEDGLGSIFPLDTIRRMVHSPESFDPSVGDDEIDGMPLKVLTIRLTGVPDSLFSRYWIDPRRSGQVVRVESYLGNVMASRLDIQLAPFSVDGKEVWMPVSGQGLGYAALEHKVPIVVKGPTSSSTIQVVEGTMAFNQHPGSNVFTLQHKPGPPMSDRLRKMWKEYDGSKTESRKTKPPSRAETDAMLKNELAQAKSQKKELVAVPASAGFPLSTWLAGGLGTTTLVGLIALAMRRRA